MSVLVKICGLTRPEDVAAAVDAGADLVGFVLEASSLRSVTPERAASWRQTFRRVCALSP